MILDLRSKTLISLKESSCQNTFLKTSLMTLYLHQHPHSRTHFKDISYDPIFIILNLIPELIYKNTHLPYDMILYLTSETTFEFYVFYFLCILIFYLK